MKKETKEIVRLFGVAILVVVALPLAYRACVYFWPPEEKPRQSLAQFLEEVQTAGCMKLLVKPIAKWTDADAKLEPGIYAWLVEQGNEILPWDWTEEARRKDPKGYAKCWRRIWKERTSQCEGLVAEHQREIKRLGRDLQILNAIHAHRTNQIARLRSIAATNTFPCQVSLERLEKGRFWGWNKRAEVVECKDAASVVSETNSVCSKELVAAQNEITAARALSGAIAASKAKSALCQHLCEICDKCNRLIESEALEDEFLKKSLVENLKGSM